MRTDPRLHPYRAPSAARPTVVVIDQDEDARRILALLFGAAGMHVVAADDAATAARELAERRPAVIVSEVRGRAAFAASLLEGIAAQPVLRGVPLVVHTSRVWPGDLAHAKACGVAATFTKPASLASLLACVRMLAMPPSGAGGQDEREHAAGPRRALDVDPPAVPFRDATRDREPQAGPCAA